MAVEFLLGLVDSLSYLGLFFASIIIGTPLILPFAGIAVLSWTVASELNPILVAGVSAAGAILGSLTAYYAGLIGNKISKRIIRRHAEMEKFLTKYFHRFAFLVIFSTAFLPFPFLLTAVTTGISKYSVQKFLIGGFAGLFLKTFIYFMALKYGISLFGNL